MTFDRAHRLGPKIARKPRPIVVKFHSYSDRETIRCKSLEPGTKSKLRDQRLGIGVQSPQEHREARKALYPLSKREEERGKRTRITGNTLFVNNVPTKKYVDLGFRLSILEYKRPFSKTFRPRLHRNVQKYDVVFFTGTFNSNSTCVNLDIKGYECFHMYGNKTQNVKKGRYSGGLFLIVDVQI